MEFVSADSGATGGGAIGWTPARRTRVARARSRRGLGMESAARAYANVGVWWAATYDCKV